MYEMEMDLVKVINNVPHLREDWKKVHLGKMMEIKVSLEGLGRRRAMQHMDNKPYVGRRIYARFKHFSLFTPTRQLKTLHKQNFYYS
jgi:hypothetical protein